jgi:hypothetical protein
VNAPSKHHFLPEFYLRRWAGEDGQFTRFTSVHAGKIAVRRTHPAQAGFKHDLYRLPGDHADDMAAQLLEWGFFRHVDNDAARALAILLGEAPSAWATDTRSGWSRFLLSLLHRTPRHWEQILDKLARLDAETLLEVQVRYTELRGPTDPETFNDWIAARDRVYIEKERYKMAARAIDNEELGTSINNIEWRVHDLSQANHALLTSDNAIVLVAINLPEGHLALPISPTNLFVAARHRKFHSQIETLARTDPSRLVRGVNRLTVERADEVVIAHDESQRLFIQRHFGTRRIRTFGVEDSTTETVLSSVDPETAP